MKLFQITQKNLAALSFIPNQDDNHHHHFNKHHVGVICASILIISSEFVYLFHVADSVEDYMHSFYMITISIGFSISYTASIFKTTELYNFIEYIQTVINESE